LTREHDLAGSGRVSISRQPLVHFALLGAAIFGVAAARDRIRAHHAARGVDPHVIVVRPELARALRTEAARRNGSAATPEIERAAVRAFVDEEILYREAIALGLDRGDPIVRRRLVQEMETILRGLDARSGPDDRELAAWVSAHRERYVQPARVAFRHVFVSRERSGRDGLARATALFAALDGSEIARGAGLGDPFVVSADVPMESEREIAAAFGPAVAAAAMRAASGRWLAPVESPSGWHVVFVRDRMESRVPAVAEVRSRAAEDFRVDRGDQAFAASLARLRARYRVQ